MKTIPMNTLQLRLSDAANHAGALVVALREAHSLAIKANGLKTDSFAELAIRQVLGDAAKLQQRVEQLAGAAR